MLHNFISIRPSVLPACAFCLLTLLLNFFPDTYAFGDDFTDEAKAEKERVRRCSLVRRSPVDILGEFRTKDGSVLKVIVDMEECTFHVTCSGEFCRLAQLMPEFKSLDFRIVNENYKYLVDIAFEMDSTKKNSFSTYPESNISSTFQDRTLSSPLRTDYAPEVKIKIYFPDELREYPTFRICTIEDWTWYVDSSRASYPNYKCSVFVLKRFLPKIGKNDGYEKNAFEEFKLGVANNHR